MNKWIKRGLKFVRACVLACLRACVLACLRACVLACLRACVLACLRASSCYTLPVVYQLLCLHSPRLDFIKMYTGGSRGNTNRGC